MNSKINVYNILADFVIPHHWPKTSIYRLRSVRARVLKKCGRSDIEITELLPFIKKITKDSLVEKNSTLIKVRTLNTYRSVLIRYLTERIVNRHLSRWEAIKFINSITN